MKKTINLRKAKGFMNAVKLLPKNAEYISWYYPDKSSQCGPSHQESVGVITKTSKGWNLVFLGKGWDFDGSRTKNKGCKTRMSFPTMIEAMECMYENRKLYFAKPDKLGSLLAYDVY